MLGSINLINLSIKHKIKCFVFTSSIAVYGKNQLPMTEETNPKPEDPYGIAKLAVEYDLASAYNLFGLNYIIFRPHNVYGERQNLSDKYRNVIGIFINKIIKNEPLIIFGDGEQTRAFSYIGDVAPVIAKSILEKKAYNEVFNIGADEVYSVNQLAQEVIKAMGQEKHQIIYEPSRNEVVHAYSSHEKIKRILGYKASTKLQEGIKKMAQWAKNTGIKESEKFNNIEIEENLPPSWK